MAMSFGSGSETGGLVTNVIFCCSTIGEPIITSEENGSLGKTKEAAAMTLALGGKEPVVWIPNLKPGTTGGTLTTGILGTACFPLNDVPSVLTWKEVEAVKVTGRLCSATNLGVKSECPSKGHSLEWSLEESFL